MIRVRTRSVEETRALAAALAELVRAGDLVVLAGDLGAGKTAFTQGFGRALGVSDPITSPTFTLARQYQGRLRLHHLDVYRFEQLDEVHDVGLPELLDDDAVTVVEWGDVLYPVLPADLLEIRLEIGPGDDDREIAVRPVGERWAARTRALAAALAPWVVTGPEGEPPTAGGPGC